VFVNDPLLVAAAAAAYNPRVLAAKTDHELRRFVGRSLGPRLAARVDTRVALGDPAREIRKAARQLRSDLIVLGTQGLGRAGKLFFGSTAEQVLRRTGTPTLVVPRMAGPRRPPAPSWPSRLLAALELGGHAAADVRAASEVARWFKARLLLVTVVPTAQVPRWLRLPTAAGERARLNAARTELEALASRFGPTAASVRVLAGRPADQISAAAFDVDAGLIVLQLRRADRLLGARRGSITYRVLCQAAMPVLALASPAGAS
jgi:nucleotide-binding universal stress UspA family protein